MGGMKYYYDPRDYEPHRRSVEVFRRNLMSRYELELFRIVLGVPPFRVVEQRAKNSRYWRRRLARIRRQWHMDA